LTRFHNLLVLKTFSCRGRSAAAMNVRFWQFLFVLGLLCGPLTTSSQVAHDIDEEDDDFAEFDDFDEDSGPEKAAKSAAASSKPDLDDEEEEEEVKAAAEEGNAPNAGKRGGAAQEEDDEEEAVVEEEESEFSHLEDDEEFEGYEKEDDDAADDQDEFEHDPKIKERGARADRRRGHQSSTPPPPPKTINIAKIPAHLRNNWENYYLEILMTLGLIVYFLNFFTGKAKNQKLANVWFSANKSLLESNFSLVGDDGAKNVEDIETQMQKESENLFTLWCSGRTCCEGMLVEIKLLKRQDIVSLIADAMKPGQNKDQIRIKVHMNPEDMDSYVFCLAQKKAAAKMAKELNDVMTFCPERKSTVLDKYGLNANVSSNFCVMSEIPEVTAAMLDSKMVAVLSKYPEALDSIHFSDQYTGVKPSEEQAPEEWPAPKKVLIFTFNINVAKGQSVEECMESLKPMMMLVFYFMDKIKRFRLSREAKNKADKNRSKVSERFWKSIHAVKAVKAQEERERKRRELKEKIKDIEDPDKQRKLEEREQRRERKKAAPKMKQLKVKAM